MNISFFLTQAQVRARTKTVTRRLGWAKLQPGQRLEAIVKGRGVKKCDVVHLGTIECVSNRPEPLKAMLVHPYGKQECIQEGFPEMNGAGFISFFCEANHTRQRPCTPDTIVNRIEFKYL